MTTRTLNLTQHNATPDQLSAGVYEPKKKAQITHLLTFDALPNQDEIRRRAILLATLAAEETGQDEVQRDIEENLEKSVPSWDYWPAVMIGGAPYLMSALEEELKLQWLRPVYAFSVRESAEQKQPDGSVKKVAVFKHAGFVESQP